MSLDRRGFLKRMVVAPTGLMRGSTVPASNLPLVNRERRPTRARDRAADVIVVGAGAFGGWTAYYLMRFGASVKLVDAYGPGNSRSTSGDETRGGRSSYGDKTGGLGELWMLWAREAMKRWITFDDEWGRELRLNLFHTTGDLIMRTEWDNFQLRTK